MVEAGIDIVNSDVHSKALVQTRSEENIGSIFHQPIEQDLFLISKLHIPMRALDVHKHPWVDTKTQHVTLSAASTRYLKCNVGLSWKLWGAETNEHVYQKRNTYTPTIIII